MYELCKKKSEDFDYMNEYRIPESYDVNQNKRFSVASQIDRDLDDDRLTKKPVSEQKAGRNNKLLRVNLNLGQKIENRDPRTISWCSKIKLSSLRFRQWMVLMLIKSFP